MGKIYSEIISELKFRCPVDTSSDIRTNTSPALDTLQGKFSANKFHIEQLAMLCEVILMNIFRETGCNEGLYHCLRC